MSFSNSLFDRLTTAILLVVIACISGLEEESCYSFAGGNIYPHGVGSSIDHKLQFTKAVSK